MPPEVPQHVPGAAGRPGPPGAPPPEAGRSPALSGAEPDAASPEPVAASARPHAIGVLDAPLRGPATEPPRHLVGGAVPAGDEPPVADDDRRRLVRGLVDAFIVVACVAFTVWQLKPGLLVSDTTPAGGDMGAHVWGPAYLRDQLLPNLQLAGWTKDWYAGFPAYQFYMVVPSLFIVVLNAGVHGPLAVVPLLAGVGLGVAAWRWRDRPLARNLAIAGAVVALALVGLPYGVAFKWVSVSGVVTLPVAVYAFGRLARLDFPTPAALSAASLVFLFYRGFTIYGGNIASTLAGEFAFSMALSCAVLYLGFVFRGLETGRYRAWAAALLAVTGLCHLIVAFWALAATAVVVLVRFNRTDAPLVPCVFLTSGGAALAAAGLMLGTSAGLGAMALLGFGALCMVAGLWLASESVRWLTPVMVVGGLLAAFWVGPFYLRRAYLNDMGWEKLPYTDQTIWQHLFPSKTPDVDLRWVFALAVVGAAISLVLRLRAGVFLLVTTIGFGLAFVVVPEGRLWNGRLLPFYYLTVMLLAGMALPEVVRTISRLVRAGRPAGTAAGVAPALGSLLGVLVVVGLPLGALPLSERAGTGFDWPGGDVPSPLRLHAEPESFVGSWDKWNYSGYEDKDSYREYRDVVQTMAQVGRDEGCGRAFWEYEEQLDRYGTPMALMLLPFWTDGCIGSMEGLYFEASATTPFHFLTQVDLSTSPSAAQRDLPYGSFDINRGVAHLQLLGVKYYMATSDQAIAAARQHPDLTEVASSGPWVVFEVADSDLVQPLDYEPAVLDGVGNDQVDWVEQPLDANGRFGGPAVSWFIDPSRWDVYLASDGPAEWQRIRPGTEPEAQPVDRVEVTDVVEGEEGISFDVDQVGTPVLVKASYFPNWRVSGAEGPYRVAPNLMVVVPTADHVELTYGRTWVEYLSYTLTALGLVGLVLLAGMAPVRFRGREAARPGSVPAATGAGATSPLGATSAVPTSTVDGDGDGGGNGSAGTFLATSPDPPSRLDADPPEPPPHDGRPGTRR